MKDSTRSDQQVQEIGLVGVPGGRMNGRTPAPPPQTMRPLDVEPVEQGPHRANDAALWMSPERIAAIRRAEAIDAEDWTGADDMPAPAGSVVMARARLIYEVEQKAQAEARDAWSARQKLEADDRRRRGVERMHRGLDELRDRRDADDAERTRR